MLSGQGLETVHIQLDPEFDVPFEVARIEGGYWKILRVEVGGFVSVEPLDDRREPVRQLLWKFEHALGFDE